MPRVPKCPDVASLAGAAGKLIRPREFAEMFRIAREDAIAEKLRSKE